MINNAIISKIAVQIGAFSIRWYAIFIVIGAVLAVWLGMREGTKRGLSTSDDWIDFVLLTFPFAIIGARAYYVIFQWDYYSKNPSEIIAIWDGGLAIYGGLIVGAFILILFTRRRKINPWDFSDLAIPGVLLAQAMGRWGNFINQEAYGDSVKSLSYLPKFIQQQMFIDGSYRQPTFLFESLGTLTGFLLIILLRHRLKFLKSGDIFCFYLIWYGFVRFFVEGLRTDSLMWGDVRVSQALSIVLVFAGVLIIIFRRIASASTPKTS
ncbi:MAG: prolipoprotein diacylglyceryl transferase [Streptococcaceae bacterium]|jgi:phosphatidylglycerol:prolipoprotein diacylglycerol transferase|nr:prolipoprotein diacylglyceryl transferase [Streptococcaceae bacterium]